MTTQRADNVQSLQRELELISLKIDELEERAARGLAKPQDYALLSELILSVNTLETTIELTLAIGVA